MISSTIGSDGFPIISYLDNTHDDIRLLHCTSQDCSTFDSSIVINSIGVGGNNDSSIAIGTDNNPVVSYAGDSNISLVHCTSVDCSTLDTPVVLDSGFTFDARENSIAIGTDNNPVISYYDDTNLDLKFVHCTSTDCSTFDTPIILDANPSGLRAGQNNAMTIGSDGFPLIVYNSFTFGDNRLNLIHCNSSDCSSIPPDPPIVLESGSGFSPSFVDIAIGTDNNPSIGYTDTSDLKFVHCTSSDCSTFDSPITLISAGDVGRHAEIEISNDGFPLLSYANVDSGSIEVLHCDAIDCSGSFNRTTIDGDASLGLFTHSFNSLAIGNDNNPVISYYDDTNDDLKFVHCTSSDCSTFDTQRTVDSQEIVFITGTTSSSDFPQTTPVSVGGSSDAFVLRTNNDLDTITTSALIGGSQADTSRDISMIYGFGHLVITGDTFSNDYPTTTTPFGPVDTDTSITNVFVTRLLWDDLSPIFSTLIGGADRDEAFGITQEPVSNIVYITGRTLSDDYPTTGGAYDTTHHGPGSVFTPFVSKLDFSLAPLASTFIGDTVGGSTEGYDIAYDATNGVYVTGIGGPDVTPGALDETPNGAGDAFVSNLTDDLTTLTASTLIGGAFADVGWGIALDTTGDVFITGETSSSDYPTTPLAFDTTVSSSDGFISRISSDLLAPDTTAPTVTVSFSPSRLVQTGDVVLITAIFDEPIADSPVPTISISGSNTLSTTAMTKVSDTEYTYSHTVGPSTGANPGVLLITAQDLAGNPLGSTLAIDEVLWLDNSAPSQPIITSGNDITNDVTPFLQGDAEPSLIHDTPGPHAQPNSGISIQVTSSIDGILLTTTSSNAGNLFPPGQWTFDDLDTLTEGVHTITVTATDGAGNVSVPSDPVTIQVDITDPTPVVSTLQTSPTNASLIVYDVDFGETIDFSTFTTTDVSISSGIVSQTELVAGGGGSYDTYRFNVLNPADGLLSVSIQAGDIDDLAGNPNLISNVDATVTIDTTPSAPPIITVPTSPTGDSTPTITGTGVNGDLVALTSDLDGPIGTDTVTGGAWSITTLILQEGTHSFTATQQDPVGNTSGNSAAQNITIDLTAPTATDTPTSSAGAGVSLAENAAGYTITVPLGTSGAVEDDEIELFLNDSSLTLTSGNPLQISAAQITAGEVDFDVATSEIANSDAFDTATAIDNVVNGGIVGGTFLLNDATDNTLNSYSVGQIMTAHLVGDPTSTATRIVVAADIDGSGKLNDNIPFTITSVAGGAFTNGSDVTINSTHSITAVVTDDAANIGPASSALSLEVDTNFPKWSINGNVNTDFTTDVELGGSYTTGTIVIFEQPATHDGGVVGGDTVDVNTEGTYNVIYTLTDIAGNANVITETVTVADTVAPTFTVDGNASDYVGAVIELNGLPPFNIYTSGIIADIVDASTTDGGTTDGAAVVDTFTEGVYNVTYTVTDNSLAGNSSTIVETVTVSDTVAPTFTAGGNAGNFATPVELGGTYSAGAFASIVDASTTDGGVVGGDAVDVNTEGVYNVTYTVTDNSLAGNSSTIVETVTVSDTVAPTFTAGGNAGNFATPVELGGTYSAGAFASIVDASTTDGGVVGGDAVDVNTEGVYNVTYTVTDNSLAGNSSTIVETVTVSDTVAPTFTAGGNAGNFATPVELGGTYSAGAFASIVDASTTDGGVVGGDAVDVNTEGVYNVTYTVTDNSLAGNSGVITETVTVASTATAPDAPTGLSAEFESSIRLNWTAPGNDGGDAITDYQIERESPPGSATWSVLPDGVSLATTYLDVTVLSDVQYNYRVSAINSTGAGAASIEASAWNTVPIISFELTEYVQNHSGVVTITDPNAAGSGTLSNKMTVDCPAPSQCATSDPINVNLLETGPSSGEFTSSAIVFIAGTSDDGTDAIHSEIDKIIRASYDAAIVTVNADTIIRNPNVADIPDVGNPIITPDYSWCEDVDADGICDVWEKDPNDSNYEGFTLSIDDTDSVKGDAFLAFQANPLTTTYKFDCADFFGNDGTDPAKCPGIDKDDIFVELDYMTGHLLSDAALQMVIDEYAEQNIRLHILISNEVIHDELILAELATGTPSITAFDQIKLDNYSTAAIRADADALNRYKQFAHYGLSAHNVLRGGITTSSGFGEINGNDFVVSLGSFTKQVGSVDEQAGTLMHELGHNLNFQHGGPKFIGGVEQTGVDVNCKPNQFSIMNYLYQFGPFDTSVPGFIPLDYSFYEPGTGSTQSDTLTESSLPTTFTAPTAPAGNDSHSEIRFGSGGVLSSAAADGATTIPWSGDPNYVPLIGCTIEADESPLKSFDEWTNIDLDVRGDSLWQDGMYPDSDFFNETLTAESVVELRNLTLAEINAIIQNLPDSAFANDPTTTKSSFDLIFSQLSTLTTFAQESDCIQVQTLLLELEQLIINEISNTIVQAELLAQVGVISTQYENSCDTGNSVHALSSEELLNNILANLETLVDDGTLNNGEGNSLASKLENVLKSMEDGKDKPTCGQLGSFENEINAMMNSGRLDAVIGDSFLDAIAQVQAEVC